MSPQSPSWITAVVTGLAEAVVAGLAAPAHAGPEARTFDQVTYTAPQGWKVEETGRGFVSISIFGGVSYCEVAIYASQPASGDLGASFAAVWKNVALLTIDPMPAPAHTVGDVGNTRAALGSAAATIKGNPATALLIVLDAGSSVVPIVSLSSSTEALAACEGDLTTMLRSLVVRPADATPVQPAPGMNSGKLVVPPLARPLTLADLVGEWQEDDSSSYSYVNRQTGAYAGSDNFVRRVTYVITAEGVIDSHFFGIHNGEKILADNTGVINVSDGRILAIGSREKYVARGWLELPTMTVLKVNGPFYGDGIPQDILDNPELGSYQDQYWIRKSPPNPK